MNNFANSLNQSRLEIGKIEVKLNALKKKVPKEVRKTIDQVVIYKIEVYKADNTKRDKLFEVYLEMQKLIEQIKVIYADRKLEE